MIIKHKALPFSGEKEWVYGLMSYEGSNNEKCVIVNNGKSTYVKEETVCVFVNEYDSFGREIYTNDIYVYDDENVLGIKYYDDDDDDELLNLITEEEFNEIKSSKNSEKIFEIYKKGESKTEYFKKYLGYINYLNGKLFHLNKEYGNLDLDEIINQDKCTYFFFLGNKFDNNWDINDIEYK